MQIGSLGDIVFEVSDSLVKTLDKMTWSGSVNIQSHSRHGDNALQEFVSINPDGIDFTIKLSKYLGAEPMEDITKIWNYERTGTTLPLTIGSKPYGKYRWLIKSHKVKVEHHDGKGDVTSADVDVSLTEYTKE